MEHQGGQLLGLTISGIRGFTEGRPFYRPPGNPVLVGSGSYSPTQQGIPTHRYGGPAHVSRNHQDGDLICRTGTQVSYWRTQSTDSNLITVKICMIANLNISG